MVINKNIEEKFQRTERKLKELSITLQRLNDEYQQFLKDLALTPTQLKEYVNDPANFSPSIWEQLQDEKKKLDEKLNLELSNLRDPLKVKEIFSEKGKIQPHWLFVR